MKKRFFRIPCLVLTACFVNEPMRFVDVDGIKTVDRVELAKKYEVELFSPRNLIENGVEFEPMVIKPTTPIDGISLVEASLIDFKNRDVFDTNGINVEPQNVEPQNVEPQNVTPNEN